MTEKKGMDKLTKGFLIFIIPAFIIVTLAVILGDHSYELKGAAKNNNTQQGAAQNADPEFQPYINEMHKQISAKWNPPAVNKDGEVIVKFSILKNGRIKGAEITKSSGDSMIDESALKALEKASPLPPLPLSYSKDEISVNFSFNLRADEY